MVDATVETSVKLARHGFKIQSDQQPRRGRTVVEILKLAVPNMAAYVMGMINGVTNTVFIGQTASSKSALAGMGLGSMMQNCFGLSVGFGLLGALDTFVSQAYGAEQHKLSCSYLQRGRLIATAQLVWMVPVLYFSEELLVGIGQEPAVAAEAASYNRPSIFGLIAIFHFEGSKKFLANRCDTVPMASVAAFSSALHVFWCWLFIIKLDLGTAGAGYANCVTWWLQCIAGSLYLWCRADAMGFSRRAILWFEHGACQKWGEYMQVALPATLMSCAELWFGQIGAVVIGTFFTEDLAAHVTAVNFANVSFMPVFGLSATAAALVGKYTGANQVLKAQRIYRDVISLNLVLWTLTAIFISVFRAQLAAAYTDDADVQAVLERLICIYAVSGFFDSIQTVMGGVLRGLGKQAVAAAVFASSFCGVMLPLGWALTFPGGWGVYGMWYSFQAGTGLAMLFFAFYLRPSVFASAASSLPQGETAQPLAFLDFPSMGHEIQELSSPPS